jgi:hypothetical protein
MDTTELRETFKNKELNLAIEEKRYKTINRKRGLKNRVKKGTKIWAPFSLFC